MIAVLIPVEGRIEQVEFNPNAPDTWAGLLDGGVGGATGVDYITLRDQGMQMFVDEWGVPKGLPLNVRATWFMRGTGRWLSEVYGPVLLTGLHAESGESIDLYEVLTGVIVGQ